MNHQIMLRSMKRDFTHHSWSSVTSSRRLRHLNIFRQGKNVAINEATEAAKNVKVLNSLHAGL